VNLLIRWATREVTWEPLHGSEGFFKDGNHPFVDYSEISRRIYGPLLTKNDHLELDTSELLDFDGIKIYQPLTGSLQWVIQIRRSDITAFMITRSGPCPGSVYLLGKDILTGSSVFTHTYLRCTTP
jgi:hypothetical protein